MTASDDDHTWGPTIDFAKRYTPKEPEKNASESKRPLAQSEKFDLAAWLVAASIARDTKTAEKILLGAVGGVFLVAFGVWFIFGRAHVNPPAPQQKINQAFLDGGVPATGPRITP